MASWRPRVLADCTEILQPCPYITCRHNLYLDVLDGGGIRFNFPNQEPHEVPRLCSLEIAGEGEHTLEEVGALLNKTRERVRQIEDIAIVSFAKKTTQTWRAVLRQLANDNDLRS